jgi:hypothetical protein
VAQPGLVANLRTLTSARRAGSQIVLSLWGPRPAICGLPPRQA